MLSNPRHFEAHRCSHSLTGETSLAVYANLSRGRARHISGTLPKCLRATVTHTPNHCGHTRGTETPIPRNDGRRESKLPLAGRFNEKTTSLPIYQSTRRLQHSCNLYNSCYLIDWSMHASKKQLFRTGLT